MRTKKLPYRLRKPGNHGIGRWPLFLLTGALALSGKLAAAPGELSQTPLFLTTGIQPNVFLLLDDSGSMDSEVLKSEGARVAHPEYPDEEDNVRFNPPPLPSEEEGHLRLCPGYNVLAFDPDVDYTPWNGVDKDGNRFDNQNPGAAQANPYTGSGSGAECDRFGFGEVDNANGSTCNLLAGGDFGTNGNFFYLWDDKNNDGVYQAGECPGPLDSAKRIYIEGLGADRQINYANWFSYYRKREYLLKRALSQIIEESQARVGLATTNKIPHVTKGTPVGTPVQDLRDAASKEALMDNLLGLDSDEETPLRIALRRVGDYFTGADPTALFGFTPMPDPDSASGYSPILNESLGGDCQHNFTVVFSDGFWNGVTSPGVGNADGDNDTNFDGQSYADTYSDTLADVAMHFYETDLIDALPNNVPEASILRGTDNNDQQHLVTFTIAFGIDGTLSDYPPNRTDPFPWPEPVADTLTTVDDMRHAAWNGRGLFLRAQQPGELDEQLNEAVGDVKARAATAAAAVAVNSTSLRTNTLVYQAGFESERWSGVLSAFQLTEAGLGTDPIWEAHKILNSRTDPRVMISFNGNGGVGFQFPVDYEDPNVGTPASPGSELSQEQVDDLLVNAPFPGTTVEAEKAANRLFGQELVAYLRGSRAKEGEALSLFRERGGRDPDQVGGLLADIIHAAPVFVGAPDPALYPDDIETASYQAWANNNITDTPPGAKDRREMVYAGTNGGTLHGFDAETGQEVFAYFPRLIFSEAADEGVHLLAQQGYSHRYYVDNTPTVAEVFIDTGDGGGSRWRTILVGSLRGGGKGVFALDVSKPDTDFSDESVAVGKVLWEFTDNDLGFTFSRPTLAKLNNDRWAAIFGNGYNSDPDGDGAAKLFIHYLDDKLHNEVKVLDTKSGSIVNSNCNDVNSDCNGLATPAVVDLGGDGIADRVYAGDLKGNLWVFDLTDSAVLSGAKDPIRLFTAQVRDQDGVMQPQPITTQPAVTLHLTEKSVATAPNTLVFFGTGQFIVAGDSQNTEVQSFYGIWDGVEDESLLPYDRSFLVEQEITSGTLTIGGADFKIRTLTSNEVPYSEQVKGWYVDFKEVSGERVVVNPLLFGELVVYTTLIPSSSECGVGGDSWLMVHDFFTGGEPKFIAIDVNNNGTWDEEDVAGDQNVAGVSTGDLFWQPTIVQSGIGAEGTVLLPKDSSGGDSLETQKIRGASSRAVRSSWTRFEFQ